MRLIDADALEKKLNEDRKWLIEQGMRGTENILVHYLMRNLYEAPTINAVSVVRCKDCMYSETDDMGFYYCVHDIIGGYGATLDADTFCSYGERKDDEID